MNLKKLKTGRWQIRWRDDLGEQRARNFRTKDEAQEKLRALQRGEDDAEPKSKKRFADVVADWKEVRYPTLSLGTRLRYDNLLRLYFDKLLEQPITQMTPQVVDEWIRWLKTDVDRYGKGGIRSSFQHELALLRTVLSYYDEYADDPTFKMPVKRRHFIDAKLRNRRQAAPKDLSEADFRVFAQKLEEDFGLPIAAFATLQFYQALRISEAAALRWENVLFNWADPSKSRIVFSEHVIYTRSKEAESFIEPGLKNSEGAKEHPMQPEVFGILRRLYRQGAKGLVFERGGRFFTYRQVQYRFNATFERLGLPYASTHVMRHGGTRVVFDETGGDVGIAAQQLGNRQAVETYAKRSVLAFTRYVENKWVSASNGHCEEKSREKGGKTSG